MQNKQNKRYLTGFTLAETIISIALLVMLVFFMVVIVPPLIMKFRASAFKEQALFLAKSKLEEYIYAPSSIVPDTGICRFSYPYDRFYYQITMEPFATGSDIGLVNVSVWGPTKISSQANINYVSLVGLTKVSSTNAIPRSINQWEIDLNRTPANFTSFIRVDNEGNVYVPTRKKVTLPQGTFDVWVISKYIPTPNGARKVSETTQYWFNLHGMALWKSRGKLYVLGDYSGVTEFNISDLRTTSRTDVLRRLAGGNQQQQGIANDEGYSYSPAGTETGTFPSNFGTMLNAPFDIDEEGNFYVASAFYDLVGWRYRNFVAIIKVDQNGNRLINSSTGEPMYWVRDRFKPILTDIKVVGVNNFWMVNKESFNSSYTTFGKCGDYGFFGIPCYRLGQNNINSVYSFYPFTSSFYNYPEETGLGQSQTISSFNMFSPNNIAVTPDEEVFSGGVNYYPRSTGDITYYNVDKESCNIRRFRLEGANLTPVSKFGQYGDSIYHGFKKAVSAMDVSPDGKRLYVVDFAEHTPPTGNYPRGRIVVFKLKD